MIGIEQLQSGGKRQQNGRKWCDMLSEELYRMLKEKTIRDMEEYEVKNPKFDQSGNILSEKDVFDEDKEIYLNLHLADFPAKNLHGHDFFEINYVFEGSGEQFLGDGTRIDLEKGQICIMNPKAFHRIVAHEESVIVNLSMRKHLFNSSFLSMIGQQECLGQFFLNYFLSQKDSAEYLLFKIGDVERIEFLLSAICDEYLFKKPYYQLNINCFLPVLFSEIVRSDVLPKEAEQTEPKETSRQMRELLQYLSENLASATLKSTAEHFHYHPNYLSGLIVKNTGKSFSETLFTIRTTQTMYYLSQTDIPVEDIADLLGYSHVSSFYSAARKMLGMTPVQYRRENRKS